VLIIQVQQVPVVLGSTGTILLGLIIFALTVLNAIQYYKAKNVERLTNALSVTETEMDVYKSRCLRLEKENADLHQENGALRAKTDLSQVIEMLSVTVDLSRKFDRENAQLNINIVKALEKHGESDVQIFGSIDQSLKATAATLNELKNEVHEQTSELRDHKKNAAVMVDSLTKEIRRTKRHE
jgi:hypothetical protein